MHCTIVKRMPLCSFPDAWNTAPGYKQNSNQTLYLKEIKKFLLQSIINQPSNIAVLTMFRPSPPPPQIPISHCHLVLTILTSKKSIENTKFPPFQNQNKI
jgi:hypothetical protein